MAPGIREGDKAAERAERGIFLENTTQSQYFVEMLNIGIVRRFDANKVCVDETVPDGSLLPGAPNIDAMDLDQVGEVQQATTTTTEHDSDYEDGSDSDSSTDAYEVTEARKINTRSQAAAIQESNEHCLKDAGSGGGVPESIASSAAHNDSDHGT